MNSHLLNKNIHAAEDKKHTATSVRKEKKKRRWWCWGTQLMVTAHPATVLSRNSQVFK